jgi:hypothetical protein
VRNLDAGRDVAVDRFHGEASFQLAGVKTPRCKG